MVVIATLDSRKKSSEDDAVDKGKEGRQSVEGHQSDGHRYGFNHGRDDAIEKREPRQNGNKHGKVDGSHVAIIVGGDDIADEGGDDQRPQKL